VRAFHSRQTVSLYVKIKRKGSYSRLCSILTNLTDEILTPKFDVTLFGFCVIRESID
jgi:hypothetical protein